MGIESLVSALTEIKEFVRGNPFESTLYTAGAIVGGFFLYKYDPGLFKMLSGALAATAVYVTILHPIIESHDQEIKEEKSNVIEIYVATGDRLF